MVHFVVHLRALRRQQARVVLHAQRNQIALHTINALLATYIMATAARTVTRVNMAGGWIPLTAINARFARPVIRAMVRPKLLTCVFLVR